MSLHIDVSALAATFPPIEETTLIDDYEKLFALVTPQASAEERTRYLAFVKESSKGALPGLEKAVEITAKYFDNFDLFGVIVPSLCAAVRAVPEQFAALDGKLRIIRRGERGSVTLSREQVHCLLAMSFFQLLPNPEILCDESKSERRGSAPVSAFGEIRWMNLLVKTATVGVHRLACLLSYFHQVATIQRDTHAGAVVEEDEEGSDLTLRSAVRELTSAPALKLVYERIVGGESIPSIDALEAMEAQRVMPKYEQPPVLLTSCTRIEDVASADAVVDFANKQVHIGCIIPSATQEEVLFSIFPEAFLGILLFEGLLDDEAAIIHGCRRFCEYKGYADSFRYAGPSALHNDTIGAPPSIVIIDALVNIDNLQFEEASFARDVGKALMGFRHVTKARRPSTGVDDAVPVVATGGWGCGIFRGDQTLKFLQQLIAASIAGCKLVYCTFGSRERESSFKIIAHRLNSRNIMVSDVVQWVREFSAAVNYAKFSDFEHFVLTKLQ